MLIAEDILLLGTDERGRDLFQQYRQIVVGGTVLTELMLRGNLGLDGKGKIQVREAPAPTEPLLAADEEFNFSFDPEWVLLVEFYCPGCGTMIENEYLPPGHPLTWDIELDLDALERTHTGNRS